MDSKESAEEAPCCRVCHGESEPDNQLFFPCKCDGSIKYVHQECLVQWLKVSRKAHPKCELCGETFHFQNIYAVDAPNRVTMWDVMLELGPRAISVGKYLISCGILGVLWGICLPLFTNWWLRVCWCYISEVDTGSCLTAAPLFMESLEGFTTCWYSGIIDMCIIVAASVVSFEVGQVVYRVSSAKRVVTVVTHSLLSDHVDFLFMNSLTLSLSHTHVTLTYIASPPHPPTHLQEYQIADNQNQIRALERQVAQNMAAAVAAVRRFEEDCQRREREMFAVADFESAKLEWHCSKLDFEKQMQKQQIQHLLELDQQQQQQNSDEVEEVEIENQDDNEEEEEGQATSEPTIAANEFQTKQAGASDCQVDADDAVGSADGTNAPPITVDDADADSVAVDAVEGVTNVTDSAQYRERSVEGDGEAAEDERGESLPIPNAQHSSQQQQEEQEEQLQSPPVSLQARIQQLPSQFRAADAALSSSSSASMRERLGLWRALALDRKHCGKILLKLNCVCALLPASDEFASLRECFAQLDSMLGKTASVQRDLLSLLPASMVPAEEFGFDSNEHLAAMMAMQQQGSHDESTGGVFDMRDVKDMSGVGNQQKNAAVGGDTMNAALHVAQQQEEAMGAIRSFKSHLQRHKELVQRKMQALPTPPAMAALNTTGAAPPPAQQRLGKIYVERHTNAASNSRGGGGGAGNAVTGYSIRGSGGVNNAVQRGSLSMSDSRSYRNARSAQAAAAADRRARAASAAVGRAQRELAVKEDDDELPPPLLPLSGEKSDPVADHAKRLNTLSRSQEAQPGNDSKDEMSKNRSKELQWFDQVADLGVDGLREGTDLDSIDLSAIESLELRANIALRRHMRKEHREHQQQQDRLNMLRNDYCVAEVVHCETDDDDNSDTNALNMIVKMGVSGDSDSFDSEANSEYAAAAARVQFSQINLTHSLQETAGTVSALPVMSTEGEEEESKNKKNI